MKFSALATPVTEFFCCPRSQPRRAIPSTYSIYVRERTGSISTHEVSEKGREISRSITMTKFKRKGERVQPCLTPLDVVKSGESFPYTRTRPHEFAYTALKRV
ncbi:hypothetical protein CSKR_109200 [Clonorchis sinensis]|uniref:Uncharacterized protein n=1 Tax=Clonorchis sinensis TaxID=79923 RepID=A0A3R7DGV0_CLOSI|nr:hypothetical protein CSKR_109200 [Clonorchis sinensis]